MSTIDITMIKIRLSYQ